LEFAWSDLARHFKVLFLEISNSSLVSRGVLEGIGCSVYLLGKVVVDLGLVSVAEHLN
jgi:uncharacterized membrane protein